MVAACRAKYGSGMPERCIIAWPVASGGGRERMSGKLAKEKGTRGRGEATAGKLLATGLRAAGLRQAGLAALPKGDWRKRASGRLIRRHARHTAVPLGRVAAKLAMGVATRASTQVGTEQSPAWSRDWKTASRLLAGLDETLRNVD
jgi:hypothetical protein